MNSVLAIDDHQDNLIAVKALLKLFVPDCYVITADSGKEGIQKAISEQPDTILLDIHMPEMDGFDVVRELKKENTTCNIPIIMLTAIKTDTKSRVKALELGADAFLTKPINEAELGAQVKAMLRIKKAEDTLRSEKQQLEEIVQQRVKELNFTNDQLLTKISEKEKAEEFLRASEARFRKMIEKSPLPMVITDENQDIIHFNDKFTELFGYTLEDVSTAQAWWEIVYPDENYRSIVQQSWSAAIEKAAETNTDIEMQEWDLTIKDRTKRTCEFNMVPLGETSLIVMKDVTHRKKAEQERVNLEKQLQQAQKMEAVGALAGGIAHDFNNILYPLIGFAEMLKEDIPEKSVLHEFVDEILQAGFRAKDLVKQIMTFSRQMDQDVKPVKVQKILKEALNLSSSIIPATITIKEYIASDCKPIIADPSQIHQLIMNLITNAYHAMQSSGGILSVTLEEKTFSESTLPTSDLPVGTYICLSVEDTGVGIADNVLSKIFNPYFTTKPLDKGTGLGLSVAHGIVKNYKGSIQVQSVLGQGTTFFVYFPVHQENTIGPSVYVKQQNPKGSGRILLVDDEDYVIKIEKKMLERLGYDVTPITDSEEALSLFSSQPGTFDIVITDMTMPGLTGELLSKKLLEINPDIPIIMCTGFSDTMDHEHALSIGVKALLMKPVIMSDLAKTIKKNLKPIDHENT